MKIDGICALVTGGARGIGHALVVRLLSKGAKFVAVIDIDKETGKESTRKLIKQFGEDKVWFIACDVSDETELEKAFEEAFNIHGRLDIVVNNAGVLTGPNVIAINLEGLIRGTYLAKKYMSKVNGGFGGIVVNMGSVTGLAPFWEPVYSASKHGVVGFSLTMAESDAEFTPDNIRIVVICPAGVDTKFVAIPDDQKAKVNFVTMNQVMEAFMMAIEDDTKHACCIRITVTFGVDVVPMKSPKEWQTEMKIWKS